MPVLPPIFVPFSLPFSPLRSDALAVFFYLSKAEIFLLDFALLSGWIYIDISPLFKGEFSLLFSPIFTLIFDSYF